MRDEKWKGDGMGVVGQSGWDSDEGSEDERVIGEDFVGDFVCFSNKNWSNE